VTATDRADSDEAPEGGLPELTEEYLGQLNAKLGLRLTEATSDRVVGTIPVEGNRQPYGLIHGGANAALIEALGSVAAALNAPEGRIAVGLELSCTHHRAAVDGLVTGVCVPLSRGRTISTFDVVLTDENGRRTCTGRLTCVLRDRPPAS
jgi:uncharacterized protein (TIGR00369 family)